MKLATFDCINKVTRIVEERYDPQIGLIVSTPVQLGTNSGILRTLRIKEDESQFIRWNLLNENGWLAGSGVYLAHIEMPDLRVSKNLKLAIVHK